jgi:hypothetical protein
MIAFIDVPPPHEDTNSLPGRFQKQVAPAVVFDFPMLDPLAWVWHRLSSLCYSLPSPVILGEAILLYAEPKDNAPAVVFDFPMPAPGLGVVQALQPVIVEVFSNVRTGRRTLAWFLASLAHQYRL